MADRSLTLLEPHFHHHGDVDVNAEFAGGAGLASQLLGGSRPNSGGGDRREGSSLPLAVVAVGLLALAALVWGVLRGR